MTTTASAPIHAELGIDSTSVPDAVLEKLKSVAVPTVNQLLNRHGFHNNFIEGLVPRTPVQNFVARAFTARTVPTREDVAKAMTNVTSLHRRAYDTINPGDVLVMDARGVTGVRVLGDILGQRLLTRGGVGVVTDGSVGDLAAMQDLGIALYSKGVNATGFGALHVVADLNVPVQIAGVLVMPGDILVGDPEGVVVIPQAVAADVAEKGVEQEMVDTFARGKVAEGATLAEAFPLNAALRAEFETWKAQHQR